MAGPEKERDWDKEMAEVDRLLRKLPHADPKLGSGSQPTAKRPAAAAAGRVSTGLMTGARERLGTWIKVGLAVLLGVGVAPGVWPYTHGCGLRLLLYLLGVGAVVAAGLWASVSSWKRRLGFAHVVSLWLIAWGIVLFTREVLPRIGAGAEAGTVLLCPDVPQPR